MFWKNLFLLQQSDPFLPDTQVVQETTTTTTTEVIQSTGGGVRSLAPGRFIDVSSNPLVDPANFDFLELIHKIIAYAFLFVFAMSVVFIFWGGITFILSGGQEEKVKNAVNTIRYAIIGLIVAIFSFAIVAWIGKQFNLDLIQYIKPENIFDTIKGLF